MTEPTPEGRSTLRRVVVGTAGHIDHGKTALVEALTGVDCDRWQEEKSRGITIDLGFAHLDRGDLQLGFVDVPGHERFVHNALAGLGGIDLMMLVVAADEGIMPQTREHLAICRLLEIPAALVALTKADLVDDDVLELAALELGEELEGTAFARAPVLSVSSVTGAGIPELESALFEQARTVRQPAERLERPARLPIDRSFHLRGLGVLVTGTLSSGRISAQDGLELLPPGKEVRVRSVQVHGEGRSEAVAGERTALQLVGAELDELERGMQLATPGAFSTTTTLLARMHLLEEAPEALAGFTEVRFHLLSSELMGKLRPLEPRQLEPGSSAVVEIRLRSPVVAVRGDHFVVRRPSPQTTLGGGQILDPSWPRYRGRRLEPALRALADTEDEAILFWVAAAGEAGVTSSEIARRLASTRDRVEDLLARAREAGSVLKADSTTAGEGRWIAASVYRRSAVRASRILEDFFRRERLAVGMPKAEMVRRLLPDGAADLADVYLRWLAKQEKLVLKGETVDLPGRSESLTDTESTLAENIVGELEAGGLAPPSPAEIRDRLGTKPEIFDGVFGYLHQRGRITRLPQGLFLASGRLEWLAEELRRTGWKSFTVGEFKDRFGLTRKWAIPLLEHLDHSGVTRRVGDRREIL